MASITPLLQHAFFTKETLCLPLFVGDAQHSMTAEQALTQVEELIHLGLRTIFVSPMSAIQDMHASQAYNLSSEHIRFIEIVKEKFPEVCVIVDVALAPFTPDNFEGIPRTTYAGNITYDEEASLDYITQIAYSLAKAGADMLIPRAPFDSTIPAIYELLRSHRMQTYLGGYCIYYTTYDSGDLYSTAMQAPSHTDPCMEQYNTVVYNTHAIIRRAQRLIHQGVSVLFVNPAVPFLDVIGQVAAATHFPIVAVDIPMHTATPYYNATHTSALHRLRSLHRAGATCVITPNTTTLLQNT